MAERITGHTELIGLMAYPIRHSSSPAMHNEAFAYLGLDYAYLAFEVDNSTLEDAVKRIKKLEKENAELKEELEYYKNRKMSGRQKHNAKWMAIYNDFVAGYESGMTMIEIARRNNVSERTIYRYKAYYDKMRKVEVA